VRAVDDAALVARLRARAGDADDVPAVEPASRRGRLPRRAPAQAPARRRGRRDRSISDDPAYFGGYLVDNYLAVSTALGLSRTDLAALARNSITGSLLPAARRAKLLAELDAYVAAAEPECPDS